MCFTSTSINMHLFYYLDSDYDYEILKAREKEKIDRGETQAIGYPWYPTLKFVGRRYSKRSPWLHARESHPRKCKKSSENWGKETKVCSYNVILINVYVMKQN